MIELVPGWPKSFVRIVVAIVMSIGTLVVLGCGTSGTEPATSLFDSAESLEKATEKGPVKLVVRVTPREPRLSDMVQLEIVTTAPAGIEIKPPAFGQAVGDFVVRDYSEKKDLGPNPDANSLGQRRFVYKLEPMSSGIHLIRPMTIEFVDNRPLSEQKGIKSQIESDPLEVNVTSELRDQVPNLANLEPMASPRPIEASSYWGWGIAAVAIVLAVIAAIWFRRRGTHREAALPTQTPEEIAHAAFAALLAERLPEQGLFPEFYVRLTGIVRNFIEATTGLRAPEQTTEEFLRDMRSKDVFSAERSNRLKEFLEAADMVKYAGQQPDQDQLELSIARAREFVNSRSQASSKIVAAAGEV